MPYSTFPRLRVSLVSIALMIPTAAPAQTAPDGNLPPTWVSIFDVTTPPDAASKPRHVQLFRIGDPIGLDADDAGSPTPADNGPDWIQVWMGNDNPFFDLRRPGDPGGVGFYKVNSQMQVVDTGTTKFAVAMRAVTPAGLDQDGVQNGQTVVSPAFYLSHQLDDGTGLHGFLSKNMSMNAANLTDPIHRSIQYGVALQRPLLETGPDNLGDFYFFMEALGRYRYDDLSANGPPAVWEMVPGLHWRMSDNLWLSGGVLVPVNSLPASREAHLWQLTCSFQY